MKRDTGDAKMEGGISELRKITAELQQENIKTNYQIAEILGTSLCDSQQSGKEAEDDNTKGDNGTNLHGNFTFERITEYKRRIFDDFAANTSGFSRKSNDGVMKSYEEDVHALDVLYKDRICSIGNRLVTRGYDESKLLLSAKSDILRVERHILKQAKEKSRDNGKCTELMEENKRVLEDLDIVWNNKVCGLVLRMSELETMEKIYSSKLEAAGNNGKIEKRGGIRYLWDIIMYPFGSYNQKGVSRSIMDIDGVDKQSESEIIEGMYEIIKGVKNLVIVETRNEPGIANQSAGQGMSNELDILRHFKNLEYLLLENVEISRLKGIDEVLGRKDKNPKSLVIRTYSENQEHMVRRYLAKANIEGLMLLDVNVDVRSEIMQLRKERMGAYFGIPKLSMQFCGIKMYKASLTHELSVVPNTVSDSGTKGMLAVTVTDSILTHVTEVAQEVDVSFNNIELLELDPRSKTRKIIARFNRLEEITVNGSLMEKNSALEYLNIQNNQDVVIHVESLVKAIKRMKRIKEIYIDENKRDIEATRGDKGVCDRNWKHKIYEVVEGIKINGQRFKGSMQSQMVSSKIKAKSRPKVASKSKTKLGKQLVPKNLQIEKNKELGGRGSIEEHSKTDSNSGRGEAKRVETQELDMGRELREKLETIKREMGSRWLQVYIKPRDGDGKDTISEGEGGCSGEGLETKIPEYIFPELANRRVYQGYEELMSTPKNEGSEVREGEEQKTDPGIEMEELEECNASTTVEVDVEQRADSQNEEIEKKTKYSVTEYYLVDLISESRKKEIGQIELSSSATVEYNDGFIRLYEEYEGKERRLIKEIDCRQIKRVKRMIENGRHGILMEYKSVREKSGTEFDGNGNSGTGEVKSSRNTNKWIAVHSSDNIDNSEWVSELGEGKEDDEKYVKKCLRCGNIAVKSQDDGVVFFKILDNSKYVEVEHSDQCSECQGDYLIIQATKEYYSNIDIFQQPADTNRNEEENKKGERNGKGKGKEEENEEIVNDGHELREASMVSYEFEGCDKQEIVDQLGLVEIQSIPLQHVNNAIKLMLEYNYFNGKVSNEKSKKSTDKDGLEEKLIVWTSAKLITQNSGGIKNVYFGQTNKRISVFAIKQAKYEVLEAQVKRQAYGSVKRMVGLMDVEPNGYLELIDEIEYRKIERIDVGPNRQYLAIHFKLADGISELSLKSGGERESMVFIFGDRLVTSDIVDNIVVLQSQHMISNKKIKINHDVEWSMQNIKHEVLIPTSRDVDYSDLVIDKVTFDFLKLYLKCGLVDCSSDDGNGFNPNVTLLATAHGQVYLVGECNEVWPLRISDYASSTAIAACRAGYKVYEPPTIVTSDIESYDPYTIAKKIGSRNTLGSPLKSVAGRLLTSSSTPFSSFLPLTTSQPQSQPQSQLQSQSQLPFSKLASAQQAVPTSSQSLPVPDADLNVNTNTSDSANANTSTGTNEVSVPKQYDMIYVHLPKISSIEVYQFPFLLWPSMAAKTITPTLTSTLTSTSTPTTTTTTTSTPTTTTTTTSTPTTTNTATTAKTTALKKKAYIWSNKEFAQSGKKPVVEFYSGLIRLNEKYVVMFEHETSIREFVEYCKLFCHDC